MDVSLGSLRDRLFALRSWDSTGETLNNRIRSCLNLALDRLSGDVPEALVPDEEHIVLRPDVVSTDEGVGAKALSYGNDKILLRFIDSSFTSSIVGIAESSSTTSWKPKVTGEWDGIMHLELTAPDGTVIRRQSREWFTDTYAPTSGDSSTQYVVSLDRPLPTLVNSIQSAYTFRIHQPEFFVSDDVIEVLEPAAVYDSTRQQVWKIDTAGAHRQSMIDFQGDSKGRPYRCWRGRHFNLPAPTLPPTITRLDARKSMENVREAGGSVEGADSEASDAVAWNPSGLKRGVYAFRYTYVWGRRDEEWQQSPMSMPGRSEEYDNAKLGVAWAMNSVAASIPAHGHDKYGYYDETVGSDYHKAVNLGGGSRDNLYTGINDPIWESAPSPVTIIDNSSPSTPGEGTFTLSASNIDVMLGFGNVFDALQKRSGHSGYRIRYYVAYIEPKDMTETRKQGRHSIETNERFYLLAEADSSYDFASDTVFSDGSKFWTAGPTHATLGVPRKSLLEDINNNDINFSYFYQEGEGAGRLMINGSQLFDYQRPLKHSTGYYAWKAFPHQDARYELDFRVLRLPRKYIHDQDTAPIQRDAVPALLELALYYVSLDDGNDQASAQAHLSRYQDLVRGFRERYANTGGIVEPTSITGYSARNRYGNYGSTALDD